MSKNKGVLPVPVAIEAVARKYTGRILTVIDSVLPEGQQNKATKDVLRGILHSLWNDPMWDSAGQEVEFSDELSEEEKLEAEALADSQPMHTDELHDRLAK